jgi:preprotein translocase subunit SecA
MHKNDETVHAKGLKTCYQAKIVYGTSSQFQFDILRDEFSLLGTRQGRRYDVVIIDEVDSMFIDENIIQ